MGRWFPSPGTVSVAEADKKDNQIDDEEQDNGPFQNQHPAVGPVMLQKLIKIIQRLEFLIDRPVPVREVETGGDVLVNSRQMPVSEKFGDVGKLVAEPREVHADFLQFVQHTAAATKRTLAQVAIRSIQSVVQKTVVRLQLGQLQIGQFDDVQRFVEVLGFIDDQRRIPVDDHEVMFVIAQM